jgi:hypothetical protein
MSSADILFLLLFMRMNDFSALSCYAALPQCQEECENFIFAQGEGAIANLTLHPLSESGLAGAGWGSLRSSALCKNAIFALLFFPDLMALTLRMGTRGKKFVVLQHFVIVVIANS